MDQIARILPLRLPDARFVPVGRSGNFPSMLRTLTTPLATLCALLVAPSILVGQASRLPGSVEAGLLLRQLGSVKRVLVVAAHPDDEDTSLLTTLARGWGAEAAYFSFTRGEGGQNLIGSELGEGLGIVRSGELLAARAIDGAGQYFGRAFDFGYSKSADEAVEFWPRETLLSDLVWVIRKFRPQVLVTMWSGTPSDGHGQHQLSGLLTREAWDAAGDPARFPEQFEQGVEPWTPLKFYRRTFFDPESATLVVATGTLDPLLGRSYHQVAMESRSQHRSQDFGSAIPPGPRSTYLALIESRVDAAGPDRIFGGVDTTLVGLTTARPAATASLASYRHALDRAKFALNAADPASSFPALADAQEALDSALRSRAGSDGELRRELTRQRALLSRAALAVTGVRFELRSRDDVLVPGQSVLVEARVWNGGKGEVTLGPPKLRAPAGWLVSAVEPDADVEPENDGPFARFFRVDEPVSKPGVREVVPSGELRLWRYEVTVPADAEPAGPYFLERPRDGAIYRFPHEPETRSLPFRPPPLTGVANLTLSAAATPAANNTTAAVEIEDAVRYRGVTGLDGEFWRPIFLAPRLSVAPERAALIWPTHRGEARELEFRLVGRDPSGVEGSLALDVPEGWRTTPTARDFTLDSDGAETTLTFLIEPPANASEGEFFVRAQTTIDGRSAPAIDARIIDYPHLEPRLVLSETTVRIVRFPVQVADRRIGYVMGSGDDGPDAIRQFGLDVATLEAGDWSPERLDRFDTIVLGVRAYEVREDLIAANQTLLEWVARGGTLLVQYNRYAFNRGSYAPFPISIDAPAPRVTDENATISILDEGSPILAGPNRIGAADFEGWVQERGLYFPSAWDDRYQVVFEMSDVEEPPQRGSLLAVRYGEGLYLHTSLSFFRQLPAAVPGAYRLFANLISLDADQWREPATP